MSAEEMRALKQVLFDKYDGFADKRYRNIDSYDTFIVDDRGRKDIGADKGLYSYFCMIIASVPGAKRVHVALRGNVPTSDAIANWAKARSAERDDSNLSFDVTPKSLGRLDELEKSLKDIVRPGAKYDVKSYKFVCPRTAKSLARLREVLADHWET